MAYSDSPDDEMCRGGNKPIVNVGSISRVASRFITNFSFRSRLVIERGVVLVGVCGHFYDYCACTWSLKKY